MEVQIPITLDKPIQVEFNGKTYRIMGGKRKYYLSQSTNNDGRKGAKGLHVAIWEFYNNQTIQKGFCIHHKDGNSFNNDISNLEYISVREHCKNHSQEYYSNEENKKKAREHLSQIRDKTKEWHASPEGKEWHRQHAKNSILKQFETKIIKVCEWCKKEFSTSIKNSHYCSRKCQQACYNKTQRNKEVYTNICNQCNKEYTTNDKRKKFCSRTCSATSGWEKRKGI